MVGLTGYPNVGKSSTINALFGSKKTAVAATPGKTKHFQTLLVGDAMMLCDCPGLVLPKYASSKAEMVAAGALPCLQYHAVNAAMSSVCIRLISVLHTCICAVTARQACQPHAALLMGCTMRTCHTASGCCRRHPHRQADGGASTSGGGRPQSRRRCTGGRLQRPPAAPSCG